MDSPIQQCSIFGNIPVNMAIEYLFKAGPDGLQQKRFSGFSVAFSKKKNLRYRETAFSSKVRSNTFITLNKEEKIKNEYEIGNIF